MMKKVALNTFPLFLIGAVILLTGVLYACQKASDEAKQQLVLLVDSAAALVASEGAKQACEAFKQPGSQWFDEDTYIFIEDMGGTEVCYPPDPSLEGQNLMYLQNSNGKFVVQKIIEMLKTEPSGWVEYMWPKPGESTDSKKLTYVKKIQPGDKIFIVGSGIYLD